LANSRIALATADTSPDTNVIATGPPTMPSTGDIAPSRAAILTSEFLYTLYSAPSGRSVRRSLASAPTVKPRYSDTMTEFDAANLSRTSATTAAFSARADDMSIPSSCGQVSLIIHPCG